MQIAKPEYVQLQLLAYGIGQSDPRYKKAKRYFQKKYGQTEHMSPLERMRHSCSKEQMEIRQYALDRMREWGMENLSAKNPIARMAYKTFELEFHGITCPEQWWEYYKDKAVA